MLLTNNEYTKLIPGVVNLFLSWILSRRLGTESMRKSIWTLSFCRSLLSVFFVLNRTNRSACLYHCSSTYRRIHLLWKTQSVYDLFINIYILFASKQYLYVLSVFPQMTTIFLFYMFTYEFISCRDCFDRELKVFVSNRKVIAP